MSSLLRPLRQPQQSGRIPLMLEFAVSPETAPYLVSSSKGMAWVEAAMQPTSELWSADIPEHVVRVAVRPDVSASFFNEVFIQVEAKGRELGWGNVHDYTEKGVLAAIEHVRGYDLGDLCLLYPLESSHATTTIESMENDVLPMREFSLDHGCLPQPCSWLTNYSAVVVPKSREFVGTIGYLGRKGTAVVVHNAARGIGIASRLPRPSGGWS